MKVKIIGAGSIGNHLSQAARRMGWSVAVVDRDSKALARMKDEIYPSRYGKWDESIELYESGTEPRGGFDVICLGTPPNVRLPIAIECLKEDPKILQLEKPLCGPNLENLKEFLAELKKHPITKVFLGYDHAVSASINFVSELIKQNVLGRTLTLDVEFREHWGGIFKAHPWLSGPEDTYLGYRAKGGGASGEHSHALHLWQYLAKISGLGTWKDVSFAMDLYNDGKVDYDSIALFNFITEKNKIGRVVQDVVTKPTRKWARLQGDNGFIEWICNGHETGDLVKWSIDGKTIKEKIFEKKRSDDFHQEMLHFYDVLNGKIEYIDSPINLEGGLKVMEVLSTVYGSRMSKGSLPLTNID